MINEKCSVVDHMKRECPPNWPLVVCPCGAACMRIHWDAGSALPCRVPVVILSDRHGLRDMSLQ